MKLDIDREVATLEGMSTGQLCERYAELFGQPVRTRHRAYLVRKIAWRLQAVSEGDLTERARRRAEELADDADVRVMPPKAATPHPSRYRASLRRRSCRGSRSSRHRRPLCPVERSHIPCLKTASDPTSPSLATSSLIGI
ncbi:MAG: DUF2924 domain-containing protein [Planctomycetes bacterium]|nr:DUF2924 domain-containing protein [Planctomycetota bacterium]